MQIVKGHLTQLVTMIHSCFSFEDRIVSNNICNLNAYI